MAHNGFLELLVVDVAGNTIRDSAMQVSVLRLEDRKAIHEDLQVKMPPKYRVELPAFPQTHNLFCQIAPTRYRHRSSGVFMITAGQSLPVRLQVMRDPKSWRARFDHWSHLEDLFRPLRDVLKRSPAVKVKQGRELGEFTAGSYDDVDDTKTILAKAGMLNLFAKPSALSEPVGGQRSWFSFVEEVFEIDRERIIARVQPEMGVTVRKIKSDISKFKDYKHTPAKNHYGNLPHDRFRFFKKDMFSIKSREENGNVQLTLATGKDTNDADVLVLDADIDENGELMQHLGDLLKHKFTGGTHPFDIHEYLRLVYPDRLLGYELV